MSLGVSFGVSLECRSIVAWSVARVCAQSVARVSLRVSLGFSLGFSFYSSIFSALFAPFFYLTTIIFFLRLFKFRRFYWEFQLGVSTNFHPICQR